MCTFKTSPSVPATRPHVFEHADVLPVHTETFLMYTRRFCSVPHHTPHTTHHIHTQHTTKQHAREVRRKEERKDLEICIEIEERETMRERGMRERRETQRDEGTERKKKPSWKRSGEEASCEMVRFVFRLYTQVKRTICTSVSPQVTKNTHKIHAQKHLCNVKVLGSAR